MWKKCVNTEKYDSFCLNITVLFVQSYSKSVQIFFQKIVKNMGEQNETKWKDEGLDCLVLDEFLIPNPKAFMDSTMHCKWA